VIKRETEIAKELLKKGNKKRALLCLKKKKHQLKLMEQAEQNMLNIETLVGSIEEAAFNQEIFTALKTGNTALEEINSQMSIEDVEKLMEDSAEAIAYQDEINEMLAGSLTTEDEDELLSELAEIEALEDLEGLEELEELEDVAVPTHKPQTTTKEEEAKAEAPQEKAMVVV